MKTPSQLIHEAHGRPTVDVCEDVENGSRCYVCCGEVARGQPVKGWLKSSFTDQNRARNPLATHVCEACCYVMSRIAPVMGRPPKACNVCDGTLKVVRKAAKGKGSRSRIGDECPKCNGSGMGEHGGNFRCYSHMYEEGWSPGTFGDNETISNGYVNASKGEKPRILEFICRKHEGTWFCSVADSGQKHLIPFTPLNGPTSGGRVLFEETLVNVPREPTLPREMALLLTAGATKDEIERGDYRPMTWLRCEAEIWEFEKAHSSERGSPWFALSLWLAQRDEEAVAKRQDAEKAAAKAKKSKPAKAAKKEILIVNEDAGTRGPAEREAARETTNANSGADPSTKKRVPANTRSKRAQALGPNPKPSDGGDANKRKPGRVGNEAAKRAADPVPKQRWLPGFD